MSTTNIINIAIQGIGTIGKRHLMAIEQIENINLSGIVDITQEAEEFCKNKNISTSPHILFFV